MEHRKETVNLIDGEKREVTVGFLSYQKKNEIFKDCLKLGAKGQEVDVKDIDYFGLKNQVMEATLRGAKISEVCEEDCEKLFDKYFGKILESIGGGSGN